MPLSRTSSPTPGSNTGSVGSTSQQPTDRSASNGAGNDRSGRATAPALTGVNSNDLLQGQKAVEIQHNGSTYRLQATRLGKLILTK